MDTRIKESTPWRLRERTPLIWAVSRIEPDSADPPRPQKSVPANIVSLQPTRKDHREGQFRPLNTDFDLAA